MRRALVLTAMLCCAADASAAPPKLEVQEVAATGAMPKGAILSRDKKTLYVTNFFERDKKNVTIYDAKTLAPSGQIDVPGNVVEGVLSPDDKTLYVSSFWRASVMFLDVATKTVTHEVKTGAHPKVLVVTRDGKTLFAANWSGQSVTQIDVTAATAVGELKVGKNPRGMTVTSAGKLYVANFYGDSIDVFEGADYAQRHRFSVCRCPRHLALSPDEKTLYVSCLYASQVHAIDVTNESVIYRVPVGAAPKSLAVSDDGRWVWTADYGDTRSLSVVDTTDRRARVFPVPGLDRAAGVVADGDQAIVTGWYDNHVYRVGFEGSGGHPDEAKKKISGWLYRAFTPDRGD